MINEQINEYKQKLKESFVRKEPDRANKVWIIKGDISGIQGYIFNVKTKGAARALKSRSNNVEVYENKYSKKIENVLSDNWEKFCGGGGFLFVSDDISKDEPSEIDEQLNIIQSEINNDLLRSEISIRLTWANGVDFINAWENISFLNNHSRYNLYNNINEEDYNRIFQPYHKEEDINDLKSEKPSGIPYWSEDLVNHVLQNCSKSFEIKNVVTDNVIDFDGLAQQAMIRTGSDLLGVLKMDVDNLGEHFKECININEFRIKSSFFNKFFKSGVESIRVSDMDNNSEFLRKFEDNIYTVFSGGDDCFFIGGWDAIVQFANNVKNKFDHEIGKNDILKGITISAGILIIDPKTPVVQIGRLAEEALSKAKSRIVNNARVKNSICIMNEIFTWTDYKELLEHTKLLEKYLRDGVVKKSLLEKIKRSSKGFESIQQKIKNRKSLPFENVWRLKHYLRDVRKKDIPELEEKLFEPYQNALTYALMMSSKGGVDENFVNPMRFPLVARLTELKTRNINTLE